MAGKPLRKRDEARKLRKKIAPKPNTATELTSRVKEPDFPLADFVKALATSIEIGDFDEHIRDIARACFKRREVLKGDAGVVKDKDKPVLEPHKPLPGQPKHSVHNPLVSNGTGSSSAKNGLILAAYTLVPVSKGSRVDPTRVFKFRGKRYWRDDVVGKTIERGTIQGLPKALMGCDLKVASVSDTGLLNVRIDSEPRSRQGRFHDMWQQQTVVRLPRVVTDQLVQSVK